MNKQNKIACSITSSRTSAELFSQMYAMSIDELIESLEDLGIRSVRSSEIKQLLIRAAEPELIQKFKSKFAECAEDTARFLTHKELGMEYSVLKSKVVRVANSHLPKLKKRKIMERLFQEAIVLRDVQLKETCGQKCRHHQVMQSLVDFCHKFLRETGGPELLEEPPILSDKVKETSATELTVHAA